MPTSTIDRFTDDELAKIDFIEIIIDRKIALHLRRELDALKPSGLMRWARSAGTTRRKRFESSISAMPSEAVDLPLRLIALILRLPRSRHRSIRRERHQQFGLRGDFD